MRMRHIASAIVVIILPVLCGSQSVHAQDADLPKFFQMNISEVDELANSAMSSITLAMSETLSALDSGRRSNTTIDSDRGTKALRGFSEGQSMLEEVLGKIPHKVIDRAYIRQSPYAAAYDKLVFDLKEAGYEEPKTSEEYIKIIVSIVGRCSDDLKVLMSTKATRVTPATQKLLVGAFLDLIAQKILLEEIGATSKAITISMQ